MNPKLPVDVLVARGKSQYSKKTLAERRESEVRPVNRSPTPPKTLTTSRQKELFCGIADKLDNLGVWDDVDAEELARYVLASQLYDEVTKSITKACRSGDLAVIKELRILQEKAHKQSYDIATALGMGAQSRSRILVPAKVRQERETDF